MTLEHVVDGKHGELTDAVAASVAERLAEQPWVLTLTKVGWAAKGAVYAVIGWAAIVIALNRPGRTEAEYTGIVTILSGEPWTRALLALVAAGLALYIAFRVISILLIDDGSLDAWAHRVGYAVSAATYVTVAWAAIDAAIDGRRENGRSSVERWSADLLGTDAGRVLVGLAAIGALAVAGYFVFKGVTLRFCEQIDLDGTGPAHRKLIEWSGAAGWAGRGLVIAAVAAFLFWAAVQADPHDARGLDRSLQEVAVSSRAGATAVFVIGLLLLLYAGYCMLSAPRRRLAWSWRNDPERQTKGADRP